MKITKFSLESDLVCAIGCPGTLGNLVQHDPEHMPRLVNLDTGEEYEAKVTPEMIADWSAKKHTFT